MLNKQSASAKRHKIKPTNVKIQTSLLALGSLCLALTGCISVKTHSSFDPIYLNLTIDLKVQLQKELANVFDDIDAASATVNASE
ncbi:hypothetical protein [Pelagicoccus albus]|uniref:YnbE-like lipoprotein n=1 Tax=Pelagicoccus albus TaxID=415222 RepID=A0A7X1B5Z2_9BACT|nr:hypothetical protein [Pelagicoccus albus]MBC2606152.1 hypothetical protein [Pelagicoccus albus]